MNKEDYKKEITKVKKIEEFLSFSGFESLLNTMILFNNHSCWAKFSGLVTASLYHYKDDGKSIFCTMEPESGYLYRIDLDDKNLLEMLSNIAAVIGKTPEESFIIE